MEEQNNSNKKNQDKPEQLSNRFLGIAIILSIILGIMGGSIASYALIKNDIMSVEKTQENLIKEFYDIENAVYVSPHSLRKNIGKDSNLILVDLRSREEYDEEHITGAVSIPAYKDRDTSDYGAIERITASFKELQNNNPGKDVVVYCYSAPCMTGRKIGKILADQDIYVKHLGIGWNEWRYDWKSFNHAHEWNITKPEDYITKGPEPDIFMHLLNSSNSCPIDSDQLGC